MMQAVISFLLEPLVGFFFQVVFSLASFLVSKKHQPWVYTLSLVSGYICLRSIADKKIDKEWFGNYLDDGPTDVVVKTAVFMPMNIGSLLFIEHHVLRHRDTFWGRLHESYKMLTNGRRIGTDKMAPQMPVPADYLQKKPTVKKEKIELEKSKASPEPGESSASAALEKKSTFTETPAELRGQQVGTSFHDRLGCTKIERRRNFIVRRIGIVILFYVLEYHLKPPIIYNLFPITGADFSIEKMSIIRRLKEATMHELVVRAYLAFESGWAAYSFYTMAHSFGSIVFVGLHLDQPHEWPPLFGDVRQAYSLRRYWVKFYDRLIYRTVSEYGKLFLRTLGLGGNGSQKDKVWQRWLLNGVLFFISGVMHAQAGYWSGSRCGYGAEMIWWMLHFYGLVLEVGLQTVLQRVCPNFYRKICGSWIGKVIGFTWVFLFLGWSAPKFSFSAYTCELERAAAAARAARMG